MGRNKIGLQFEGWKELLSGIEKASGESALKEAASDALKASKNIVNEKVKNALSKSNLPAKGRYSREPHLISFLDTDSNVEWSGYTGEINIGFEMDGEGIISVFLMYGTPKMNPVKGLKAAFYGKKTKKEVAEIQKEAINKYIQRNLGG
ncbi:MAG: hypothetical protein K2H01_01600 [Ruminococcus sp.]|nr:hypothetical protein [Ruminococcus sp.]